MRGGGAESTLLILRPHSESDSAGLGVALESVLPGSGFQMALGPQTLCYRQNSEDWTHSSLQKEGKRQQEGNL